MFKIIAPSTAMIAVTYAFARLIFGLFLPDISSSLHLSESQAGFIGTLGYISYVIALLSSNIFISKSRQLVVIQAAGLSAVIGLLGISFSQNLFFLGVSVCIAGLGSGWSSPIYTQVVKSTLPENKRDLANNYINTGTSFGIIISGPIALLFSGYWRRAFLFFSFLSLLTLIWNSMVIPNVSKDKDSFYKSSLKLSALLKKSLYLLPASILIGLCTSIFWTFSRNYLTVIYNWKDRESILFWIVMGVAGIGGSIAGTLIQSKGLAFSYRAFLLFLLLSISSIVIPNKIAIYLSAVLFGVTYIAITSILLVWGTRCFSNTPHIGVIVSFLFLGIGQTVGSSLAGLSIEYFSYPVSFILFALIGTPALFFPVKAR